MKKSKVPKEVGDSVIETFCARRELPSGVSLHIFRFAVLVSLAVALLTGSQSSAATLNKAVPKATAVTTLSVNQAVTVKWVRAKSSSSSIKITGYQVTASSGSWRSVKTTSARATSATFTRLTNGRSYTFSVQTLSGRFVSAAVLKIAKPGKYLASNSINFRQPADMFLGASNQLLVATALGGAPTYASLTPNTCRIVGVRVQALAVGDCLIRASSAATATHRAATPVERLLTVGEPPPPIQKTLLWSEEFTGAQNSAPSAARWNLDTTDGCPPPYNNCGWGNAERQYYIESANRLDGSVAGLLKITASRQTNTSNLNCYYGKCEWLSGKMTTYGKVAFTYGYMEARIKATKGAGTWPAFWMLGTNIATVPWPFSGEMDIMEFKGVNPQMTYGTVHYANGNGNHAYNGGIKDTLMDLGDDFHRYGMLWEPETITFYFNDTMVHRVSRADTGLGVWPFGKNASGVDPKFYLVLNLAMGGNFGGDVDSGLSSANLTVDWVRYYSVNGLGKVS